MAVYQVFASADATLYSRYPVKNTGRDAILEVGVNNSQDGVRFLNRAAITDNPYYTYDLAANSDYSTTDSYFPTASVKRAIVKFSSAEIAKLSDFAISSVSGSWEASLKLYLATAQNLSTNYSLEVHPLLQDWSMGTGQYAQVPESTNGVSWIYTGPAQNSNPWVNSGGYYDNGVISNQVFDYMSNKDLDVNISEIVDGWISGSIINYGLVVKHPNVIEESTSSFIDLKFFSVDTHTIYPPTLQFKWDDSYYLPVSASFVLNDEITVVLQNNPGLFRQGEVYKMRTGVRETYPARRFTTASVYLRSLYFGAETSWALQDYKTNETIVDFDPVYTRLSADSVSNYFTLYTSGLEINRYYRLLIKTRIYSTTFGPLALYDDINSIYDALSLYAPDDLALLPAEEVIFTNENLVFKIIS